MIPAEKSKREIVLELKEQGLTAKEIAIRTGMNYGTVYYHYSSQKKEVSAESEKKRSTPGHNKDRHLCKTCQYRMG
ncbi:MAG: helix-turn-helix transcriptional regulator, partial [Lachnospiraceae bacterium]